MKHEYVVLVGAHAPTRGVSGHRCTVTTEQVVAELQRRLNDPAETVFQTAVRNRTHMKRMTFVNAHIIAADVIQLLDKVVDRNRAERMAKTMIPNVAEAVNDWRKSTTD